MTKRIINKFKFDNFQINEFDLRTVLQHYSEWMQDRGYIDTDWWCEEPKAIDEYIEEL